MELGPGQETTLHFDIDLRHRKGPQQFVCRLVEEGGAEWTYTLETTLYERARFAEVGSTHFGMVDPGVQEVRETHFYLCAESPQALPQEVSFRTNSDHVRVEAGPGTIETNPDGIGVRKIPVKFRLRAPTRPGLESASVYATVAWPKEKQEVLAGVDWNVRTLISISPAQAYFGMVDPTSSGRIERRVTVRRPDGRPLVVKGVKASCPQVRCSVQEPRDGPTAVLLLDLDPKEVTKPLWGEVVLETDHPVQAIVKIPVAALPKQTQ
jgi:hypothetical protein